MVVLPICFHAVLSDGTAKSARTAFCLIGDFMALRIIGYGAVQAFDPRIPRAREAPLEKVVDHVHLRTGILTGIPVVLAVAAFVPGGPALWLTIVLVAGLLALGVVLALNPAPHS